ncbi:hypothetical protein Nepgr_007851 [Nepenthes gracilis]|uniref:Uncharacterized protein n=1 Tax=Nepenthes gracilis TaxID=150966 RepID=A0AAD3S816_NEPGR|nr:hypothetical protein Nepgr_007851 [Nepenthes gracilis]
MYCLELFVSIPSYWFGLKNLHGRTAMVFLSMLPEAYAVPASVIAKAFMLAMALADRDAYRSTFCCWSLVGHGSTAGFGCALIRAVSMGYHGCKHSKLWRAVMAKFGVSVIRGWAFNLCCPIPAGWVMPLGAAGRGPIWPWWYCARDGFLMLKCCMLRCCGAALQITEHVAAC